MPSPPSGPAPLWVVCGVALAILALTLAAHSRPSRHERSIHHHRGEMRE